MRKRRRSAPSRSMRYWVSGMEGVWHLNLGAGGTPWAAVARRSSAASAASSTGASCSSSASQPASWASRHVIGRVWPASNAERSPTTVPATPTVSDGSRSTMGSFRSVNAMTTACHPAEVVALRGEVRAPSLCSPERGVLRNPPRYRHRAGSSHRPELGRCRNTPTQEASTPPCRREVR